MMAIMCVLLIVLTAVNMPLFFCVNLQADKNKCIAEIEIPLIYRAKFDLYAKALSAAKRTGVSIDKNSENNKTTFAKSIVLTAINRIVCLSESLSVTAMPTAFGVILLSTIAKVFGILTLYLPLLINDSAKVVAKIDKEFKLRYDGIFSISIADIIFGIFYKRRKNNV